MVLDFEWAGSVRLRLDQGAHALELSSVYSPQIASPPGTISLGIIAYKEFIRISSILKSTKKFSVARRFS